MPYPVSSFRQQRYRRRRDKFHSQCSLEVDDDYDIIRPPKCTVPLLNIKVEYDTSPIRYDTDDQSDDIVTPSQIRVLLEEADTLINIGNVNPNVDYDNSIPEEHLKETNITFARRRASSEESRRSPNKKIGSRSLSEQSTRRSKVPFTGSSRSKPPVREGDAKVRLETQDAVIPCDVCQTLTPPEEHDCPPVGEVSVSFIRGIMNRLYSFF